MVRRRQAPAPPGGDQVAVRGRFDVAVVGAGLTGLITAYTTNLDPA